MCFENKESKTYLLVKAIINESGFLNLLGCRPPVEKNLTHAWSTALAVRTFVLLRIIIVFKLADLLSTCFVLHSELIELLYPFNFIYIYFSLNIEAKAVVLPCLIEVTAAVVIIL